MSDGLPANRGSISLESKREDVIELLKETFSAGYMGIEEYESRVSLAENAGAIEVLEGLVADIPETLKTINRVSESERIVCNMVTKKLEGTIVQAKRLEIEASMSTVKIDYRDARPIRGVQEIEVRLDMSNLILYLPDEVVAENRVQEEMSTYKESKGKGVAARDARTVIRITGTARMSNIKIKRKTGFKILFISPRSRGAGKIEG